MIGRRIGARVFAHTVVVAVAGQLACANPPPPIATPTLMLNRASVPLGGALEVYVRFDVAPAMAPLTEDYQVLLHFLDAEGTYLWAEDHAPPEPTTTWRPGQRVEYARRITVPLYPYTGDALVAIGLYSPETNERLALFGDDLGQLAYHVARVSLEPVPDLDYDEGWHRAEFEGDGFDYWQWTTSRAVLSFPNPGTDAAFIIDVAGRPDLFDGRQTVSLVIGEHVIDEILIETSDRVSVERLLSADAFGASERVELELHVSPTFIPAERGESDPRELGVRVFRTFIDPR